MSLYPIFSIIIVFLALAFVLIHLVAALSAMIKGKKNLGTGFIGSIISVVGKTTVEIVVLFECLLNIQYKCTIKTHKIF